MELEQTVIEDLKILHLKKLEDSRGSFIKIFNDDYFELIFSEIGTIDKVYKEGTSFDNLIDMTL